MSLISRHGIKKAKRLISRHDRRKVRQQLTTPDDPEPFEVSDTIEVAVGITDDWSRTRPGHPDHTPQIT